MKRVFVGVVLVGTALSAGAVEAAPSGGHEAEVFDCGSGPVEIITNGGPNGWVEGAGKYRAVLITFTDLEGNLVFVKARGNMRELSNPEAITCTAEDPEGTLSVIAIPA